MRSVAGAALLIALTCACGAADPGEELGEIRSSVRGGATSLVCEWPAVAALDLRCTGTLVHPEVVVYAAHCGEISNVSFGERMDAPERQVATSRCVRHPDAELGNGFDVAFCLLAEPVHDIPPIRIASGCELDALRPGMTSTLVGFGLEQDGARFGVKRSASVELASIGRDLVTTESPSGACAGDSGAPLLAGERLIGVMSAARDATCGLNVDHYSYLPPLLAWLEGTSGRDLTPCFDSEARWHATPSCTATDSAGTDRAWSSSCRDVRKQSRMSASCGEAFAVEQLAETIAPTLDVLLPAELETTLRLDAEFVEVSLEVSASDAETGVADVTFELLDERRAVRASQRDEVPPYRLNALRLPAGLWDVRVVARDHAGNRSQQGRRFVVDGPDPDGSCAFTPVPAARGSGAIGFFALVLLGAMRSTRSRRRSIHARPPRRCRRM